MQEAVLLVVPASVTASFWLQPSAFRPLLHRSPTAKLMSLLFHQQESFYATTSRVNCTLQIGDSDEKIRFRSPVKSAQN